MFVAEATIPFLCIVILKGYIGPTENYSHKNHDPFVAFGLIFPDASLVNLTRIILPLPLEDGPAGDPDPFALQLQPGFSQGIAFPPEGKGLLYFLRGEPHAEKPVMGGELPPAPPAEPELFPGLHIIAVAAEHHLF